MKHLFYFVFLLGLIMSCANTKNSTPKNGDIANQVPRANDLPADHKQSGIELTKYNWRYTIPKDWQATLSDFKATDLKGEIKAIESDYKLKDNAVVRIITHPGKPGILLFNTYYNSRRKNLFQTNINQLPAVKLVEKIATDGKGHPLAQPTTRTKIILLHPDKKGSLEIVFDSYNQDKQARAEFETFLNSIKPAKE